MLYEKNLRLGDWDYKENWRYDKQAFYNGETQYDRDNPRLRGVGYDVSDTPSPTRQYNYSRKDYAPSTERENYYRNRPQEQTNNYYNPYPYNTSQTFDSGNR
jgi:hypothetical protein